jgi:Fungal specific transcription factor domain
VNRYVRVLHHRIRELERICTDAGVQVPSFNAESTSDGQSQGETEQIEKNDIVQDLELPRSTVRGQLQSGVVLTEDITPAILPGQIRFGSPSLTASQQSERLCGESQVTGMGVISTPDETESSRGHSKEYYGSSSAASFLRQAQNSIVEPRSPSEEWPGGLGIEARTNSSESGLFLHQRPRTQVQLENLSLPPRHVADRLLQSYWERVYYLYPFFYRPAFEKTYERLWNPNSSEDQYATTDIGLGGSPDKDASSAIFHCALNAMMALGSQFSNFSAQEKASISTTLFLRAKGFINLDFLDSNSLSVVQTLLITALFLQSSPYPTRCWNAVGNATRVAIGLGLHVDSPQSGHSELEREIRRRTWCGCVIMETQVVLSS